jgi:hypothetical protein
VAADGHEVNIHLVHIQGYFTHRLGSVRVEKHLKED